jgi:signal peptidase I
MERTIQRGDHIVADAWYYDSRSPSRPDVIIFKNRGTFFVKRVIGVGGDTIAGGKREVTVNGRVIDEPYAQYGGSSAVDWKSLGADWMDSFGPVKVPDGKYFVLGDNRDVSVDSRSPEVGFIDRSSIVGKALYVFSSDRQGASIQ